MKQLTTTRDAWCSNPDSLSAILRGEEDPTFLATGMEMQTHGWIKLGEAIITIDILEESELKLAAVQQCNEAIKKVRADTEVKVAHLEQMIQNLLAIEHTPAERTECDHGVSYRYHCDECSPIKSNSITPNFTDVDDDIPF